MQEFALLVGKRLVNTSYIMVKFRSSLVRVRQEVLLYDFNAIVGTMGGSLGLFLGFSCFDVIRKVLAWLVNLSVLERA